MSILPDNESVVKFYQETLAKHGLTPEGMAYRDEESHERRLLLARDLAGYWRFWGGDYEDRSILDVGCGLGMLLDTWTVSPHSKYVGIDIVPEYVEHIRDQIDNCGKLGENWFAIEGDFLQQIPVLHPADITVAIGTFAWQTGAMAESTIREMWTLTKQTMIFTALLDRPFSKMHLMMLAQSLPDVDHSSFNYFPKGFVQGKTGVPEVMIALYKEGASVKEDDEDDVEDDTIREHGTDAHR